MRITSVAVWILAVAVAGCGEVNDDSRVDASVADAPIDGPPLTCASYCSIVGRDCTGAVEQYGSMADCMTTCARLPVGTAADTSGNTLGCRVFHGSYAGGDPPLHCPHAGPGGGGICGAECEGFCTIVLGSCTGANAQYSGSMATCMSSCAGFSTTPAYSAAVTSGNSLACRLYHATAASSAPNVHCPHTAVVSSTCQ
jgi:hypothetical protein